MVTPLYKKDDEFSKISYRPVTVRPALNNIFDRLLSGQMEEFYNGLLSDFIEIRLSRLSSSDFLEWFVFCLARKAPNTFS